MNVGRHPEALKILRELDKHGMQRAVGVENLSFSGKTRNRMVMAQSGLGDEGPENERGEEERYGSKWPGCRRT